MSKFTWAKVILVCIVTMGGFLFGEILEAGAANSDVVINEVMANALDEDTGEFVEIYNKGTTGIDVLGWGLFDASDTNDYLTDYTEANDWGTSGTIIPAGSFGIIVDPEYAGEYNSYLSSNADSAKVVMLTIDQDTTIGNSLTSSGDTIIIDDGTGYTAQYTWNSDPGNGISWEKINPQGGNLESNWKVCTDSFGSTPGTENSSPNQSPIIESASASPSSIPADGKTEATFTAEVTDEDGDLESVTIDLSPIGGEEQEMSKGSGDIYSYTTVILVGTEAKNYTLVVTARDSVDRSPEITAEISLTVTAPAYSKDIIINELLPHPETDWNKDKEADKYDEWIELYNKGKTDIDLENWIVGDSTTQKYIIKNLSIKAGQYSVIYRKDYKIALNDTGGDCVKLYHPNSDKPLDSICYTEKAEKEMAYALNKEGEWAWTTTPTPEKENIITLAEEEGDEEEEKNEDEEETQDEEKKEEAEEEVEEGKSKDSPKKLSITEVKGEKKGTWVKIKGIVTCPPGILSGSVIFYIQDEKAGIKIYSSKEDLPKIKLGDEIEVIGKASEAQGEKKINIQSSEDVTVVSHKDSLSAKSVKTGEIGEKYEGLLVIISGKVVSLHGSTFYVDDSSGKIKVSIKKSTGIDKPKIQKGEEITITGIVSEAYEAYRILPRFQEDIKLGKVKGAELEDKEGKLAKTGTSFWQIIAMACLITGVLFVKKSSFWGPRPGSGDSRI